MFEQKRNRHGIQCTTAAMDGAAANNHLEVVKWLHENRSEGSTTDALDRAAGNGHIEVVQWLHAHRAEVAPQLPWMQRPSWRREVAP